MCLKDFMPIRNDWSEQPIQRWIKYLNEQNYEWKREFDYVWLDDGWIMPKVVTRATHGVDLYCTQPYIEWIKNHVCIIDDYGRENDIEEDKTDDAELMDFLSKFHIS